MACQFTSNSVVCSTAFPGLQKEHVKTMNYRWFSPHEGGSFLCHVAIMRWQYWWTWIQYNVIKWKHFPRYRPFVRGIHRSPVNSPHKGQWLGALMFFICARINGWVNNCEAGDLRRHRVHYDVIVMIIKCIGAFVCPLISSISSADLCFIHTNIYRNVEEWYFSNRLTPAKILRIIFQTVFNVYDFL